MSAINFPNLAISKSGPNWICHTGVIMRGFVSHHVMSGHDKFYPRSDACQWTYLWTWTKFQGSNVPPLQKYVLQYIQVSHTHMWYVKCHDHSTDLEHFVLYSEGLSFLNFDLCIVRYRLPNNLTAPLPIQQSSVASLVCKAPHQHMKRSRLMTWTCAALRGQNEKLALISEHPDSREKNKPLALLGKSWTLVKILSWGRVSKVKFS